MQTERLGENEKKDRKKESEVVGYRREGSNGSQRERQVERNRGREGGKRINRAGGFT